MNDSNEEADAQPLDPATEPAKPQTRTEVLTNLNAPLADIPQADAPTIKNFVSFNTRPIGEDARPDESPPSAPDKEETREADR